MPFGRSAKKKEPLNEAGLYDYAVKALGRHMRTESEMRRLMTTRAEPGPHGESAISGALARLKDHGYLDDAAFAETYTRLRLENEKLGARRVRQDLQQKGIGADLITQAIDARYSQANEETLARQHLERKRIAKPTNEKETARVMRRLIAAGFSTSVIYKILRQWNAPDESLAALDNFDAEAREE